MVADADNCTLEAMGSIPHQGEPSLVAVDEGSGVHLLSASMALALIR